MAFMQNTIVWITAANVLYLASYSVRDILWLRVLTVTAALLLIPYYAFQPIPLTVAIAWNVLFIAINTYWIIRLIIERRPVHLTPDEARLRVLSFPSLTEREARNLFGVGIWTDLAAGESIVARDKQTDRFSVILRGIADFQHHGYKIAELGEGQFVGGIDRYAEPADMDVIVSKPVRTMCWARPHLTDFMANRPAVALALERSVGMEIQRLLDATLSALRD
jgi:hypothetical protein